MEIMSKKAVVMMLMMVISMVMMDGVVMQISIPPIPPICGMPTSSIVDCLPAIVEPKPESPTQQCCNAVKKADIPCLCSLASAPILPPLGINKDLLLALFGKCALPNCP